MYPHVRNGRLMAFGAMKQRVLLSGFGSTSTSTHDPRCRYQKKIAPPEL